MTSWEVLVLHPSLFAAQFFWLGLSLTAVQHARLVRTPFFIFALLLLGTSFTSAKHGRYVGSVSPRPETISFWVLKRRGELEIRGRPLGLHLSGVKARGCVRILYKNLTRLW